MLQILHKTNIDFMGWKTVSFAVSGLLIVLGIVSLVQIGRGKANLGIDFVGGTTVQLKFKNKIPIDQARTALEKSGFQGSTIQEVGDGNSILIRLRESEGTSDKVQAVFKQEFAADPFEVESITEIGPVIGQAIKGQALWAITISIAAIIVYIAFRFQFKFGVSAAIATVHDILAVLGIFYVMNKEINLLIVTALLTLAGYSLTDTVVVFDRIRENLKTQQKGSALRRREQQHQRSAVPDDHHLAHRGPGARPARPVRRRRAPRLFAGPSHGRDRRDVLVDFRGQPASRGLACEIGRQADREVNGTSAAVRNPAAELF